MTWFASIATSLIAVCVVATSAVGGDALDRQGSGPAPAGAGVAIALDREPTVDPDRDGELRRAVEFADPTGDAGMAADIVRTDVTFLENGPGTPNDDQIQFTSVFANPGAAPLAFADGDLIHFFVNSDNNIATGDTRLPGSGNEFLIELFFDAANGGESGFTVLYRWNGASYDAVRRLNVGEVLLVDQAGGGLSTLTVILPRAELGIGRGQTFATTSNTFYDVRDGVPADADLAPDNVPANYQITIPPAPELPALGVAVAATAVTQTSATLNAAVDPNRLPTTFTFQYGLTEAYGAQSPAVPSAVADGDAPAPVSTVVGGLAPGTTYNFRVVATNAAGTTFGPNQTVTTVALKPNELQSRVQRPVICASVDGRRICILRSLIATVSLRDPNTDRRVTTPAALRNIRLQIACTRGCNLNRTFALRAGTARVQAVRGPRRGFLNTLAGSPGRRVAVPIGLRRGTLRVDLTRLFTDGRGHPYLLPRGSATIQIRVIKPGLVGAANIIRIEPSLSGQTCRIVGNRITGCAAS